MIRINRFEVGVLIAGVSVASIAGCRRDPTTASRSAAAYDEAQRTGAPVAEGGGHGHHAPASPAAGDPEGVTGERAHAHHEAVGAAGGGHRATAPDHAAMGHGPAAPSQRDRGRAEASHEGHAGMDHSTAPAGATPTTPGHDGHGATTAATDHAAMGHASMGRASASAPARSPEPASATAVPGQPVATLRPDRLDGPAPTAVQEAARSAEMAASGHTMSHGTYRQVDAGRDEVPVTAPNADPHAGHAMPSPRPTPSPKENR